MSSESFYRINVVIGIKSCVIGEENKVVRYTHYFRLDINNKKEAIEVYRGLDEKFPAPDYGLDVTYWNNSGTDVTEDFD